MIDHGDRQLNGTSPDFYQSAGISNTSSYDLGLGQTAIGIVGTVASWFIRKPPIFVLKPEPF